MYQCVRCKATWPDELHEEWGTHSESSGYGPEPRCPAVTTSKQTGDGQVCGGQLRYQDGEAQLRVSPIVGDGSVGDRTPRDHHELRAQVEQHNVAQLRELGVRTH